MALTFVPFLTTVPEKTPIPNILQEAFVWLDTNTQDETLVTSKFFPALAGSQILITH